MMARNWRMTAWPMVDDGDEDEGGLLVALPLCARPSPNGRRRDHRIGARCHEGGGSGIAGGDMHGRARHPRALQPGERKRTKEAAVARRGEAWLFFLSLFFCFCFGMS